MVLISPRFAFIHLSTPYVMFCIYVRCIIKINLAAVKKSILLIILTFSFCKLVFAQNVEPAVFNHLLKAYTNEVEVGNELTISFSGKIPDGSLIYATGYKDCPPIAAKVRLDTSDAFELAGELRSIRPETYTDDIFECDVAVFKETATFDQKIKILKATSEVSGVLEYQICTKEGYCVLFNYPFKVKLNVNP